MNSRLEACGASAKLCGNNHTAHQKYLQFLEPIRWKRVMQLAVTEIKEG